MLKINYLKTFLPVKRLPLTSRQRFQWARNKSLEVLEEIREPMLEGKLKPTHIKTALRNSSDKNLSISIDAEEGLAPRYGFYTEKGTFKGHFFKYPVSSSRVISQGSVVAISRIFLDFFTNISNPKILKRTQTLMNSGAMGKKFTAIEPFRKKMLGKITLQDLEEFLSGITVKERIDWLQAIRYSLLKTENLGVFEDKLNTVLKNKFSTTFVCKINPETVQANKKLVEKTLLETINKERAALR